MTNLARRPPLGMKHAPARSNAVRDAARMQPCAMRLPCCNGRLDTTVYAHIRTPGGCGMGQKPSDLHGVFACSSCHDAIDRRDAATAGLWGFEDILRGLLETQRRLEAMGLIHIGRIAS